MITGKPFKLYWAKIREYNWKEIHEFLSPIAPIQFVSQALSTTPRELLQHHPCMDPPGGLPFFPAASCRVSMFTKKHGRTAVVAVRCLLLSPLSSPGPVNILFLLGRKHIDNFFQEAFNVGELNRIPCKAENERHKKLWQCTGSIVKNSEFFAAKYFSKWYTILLQVS